MLQDGPHDVRNGPVPVGGLHNDQALVVVALPGCQGGEYLVANGRKDDVLAVVLAVTCQRPHVDPVCL